MIRGLKRHGSSLGERGSGWKSDKRGFRNLKCSAPFPKNLTDGAMGQAPLLCQCTKMPRPTLVTEAPFCPGHTMRSPKLEPIHRHLSINTSDVRDGCERCRERPARCRQSRGAGLSCHRSEAQPCSHPGSCGTYTLLCLTNKTDTGCIPWPYTTSKQKILAGIRNISKFHHSVRF